MKSSRNHQMAYVGDRKLLLGVLVTMMILLLLFACVQPAPREKSSVEPYGSYAAPQLGIVFDKTMKVVDVDLGSVAEQAGIQKGDLLISVDDVSFSEEMERVKALVYESPGEEAYKELQERGVWNGITRRLKLERDGKALEVEITPAPLTWWGSNPTPTAVPTDLELDYL